MKNLERQLLATNEGGDFTPLEPGVYSAKVSKIINYGVIPRASAGFPDIKPGPCFRVEFVTKPDKEGVSAYIGKDYLLSTNPKAALTKDLTTWFEQEIPEDKAFNVFKLMGLFAKLQVGMTSTGRNNKIVSILKPTEEFETDAESFIFDVTEPKDAELFDKLPEFIQDTIKTGDTWKLNAAQPETKEVVNPANPTAEEVNEAAKEVDIKNMFN